jgi:predicted metal-binding membrane protein
MAQANTSLESVLKQDRAIVLSGLVMVVVLAWAYIGYLAWDLQRSMSLSSVQMGMSMAQLRPWSGLDFGLMYLMWAVMMVAMMVPTAAPMMLTFATINRKRLERRQPFVPTGVFLSGYLLVWGGFSLVATLAQWGLHQAALITSMMGTATPIVGGIILLAAGAYQWTPLKYVCLNQCRTPLGFIMTEWREGKRGALTMGLRHGGYCLACCWFLMGLLLVTGVMNLLWVALIAGYILAEKVVPTGGHWLSRVVGLVLVGWGAWMVMEALA